MSRRSRIFGTAAAASGVLTVTRTSSDPARASSATCFAVPTTSAVSVLVIDCTTTGAPPPTLTPPTFTATESRRGQRPPWELTISIDTNLGRKRNFSAFVSGTISTASDEVTGWHFVTEKKPVGRQAAPPVH